MSMAREWRVTFLTVEMTRVEVGRPLEQWLHYIRCVFGGGKSSDSRSLGPTTPFIHRISRPVPYEGCVARTKLQTLHPLLI